MQNLLEQSLSALLAHQAALLGERNFLEFECQPQINEGKQGIENPFRLSLSYRDFNDQVNQTCHYLQSLGLKQGDVYNLHLPNCPAFLIVWFAGTRLGAVMMPTNVLGSKAEMRYLLEHSGSVISFTTAPHQDMLDECANEVEKLRQIVCCDPFTHSPNTQSFEHQLSRFSDEAYPCPAAPCDLAAIMYTSGTTSRPKGVMVTHANYIKAGQTVADATGLTKEDRQFVVLPLFHGNAQYYSTMSALLAGASIVLMDRFSASQYFDKCIEYQCTVASLFAAPMRMILAQPENEKHTNNQLRLVIYAQNLTPEQIQNWQRRFDAPLCQLWGMTETMGPPLMNPLQGERRNWTVGIPSADYEVRLVNENGESVNTGVEGEIVVKGIPGKTIMAGYYKNDQATRETIRKDWLYTGDNAIQDKQGYFRFVDRIKDMIKRSGENVSAGEVESVILQHPAVFECAVIGMPDALRDEKIVAVVVLHHGAQATEDEIIEFCKHKLASFRVPQQVVLERSLPKTSVGKIQKHLVKKLVTLE
ncbi:MAG: AMP-binding protein [Arenicellales bacterium]